ncbi:hypothetical protein D6D22_09368 [Aureobasidium pullulans]|uniref:Cutinase n=1 Tax=Aureobasidium pullulans TaxID=5580 RepID=A0A4S8X7H9_AURPU|nr:hypothetical protein D6D22_09368 [Aureobasidium pullulans]
MKSVIAAIPLLLVGSSMATPLKKRACPNIYIFGARETTAPASYGLAGTVVNLILNAHPSSTAEVINYPAAGGDSYASTAATISSSVGSKIKAIIFMGDLRQIPGASYSVGTS